MQKKLLFISFGISFVLLLILVFQMIKSIGREDEIKIEAACQKIENFTRNYFVFLEDVKTDTDTENIAISVSFVPEVGSYPVKEEIYQNVAYHAMQITEFFPEVNRFDYILLWDDNTKQEVLTLAIDEEDIKDLADIYYNEYINQTNGLATSYKNAFSSIIETDVSKSWRNEINTYSNTP